MYPPPADTRAPRPWRCTRRVIVACAILSIVVGCAHLGPYYREGETREVAPVASADIDHRLFLIGDAGDPDRAGEPTLKMLAQRVRQLPERTTVVFLGDNAYERGMPEPVESTAEKAGDVAK